MPRMRGTMRERLVDFTKLKGCNGFLGRLFGHRFVFRDSDMLFVFDNCARCGVKRIT